MLGLGPTWLRLSPDHTPSLMPAGVSDYCCRPRSDYLLYSKMVLAFYCYACHVLAVTKETQCMWQMHDLLKGGFCYSVHAKILGPCPLLTKTTPIFKHFWEKFLALPVNLRSKSLLRHADVSHRSRFLNSLPRQGDSTYPVTSISLY